MENHWVRCGEIGLDVIILWQMRVGGRGKETKCLKRRDRRERFEASGRMASMFRCIFHEATTAPAYTMVHAIFRRRTSASFDASHKLARTNHLLSQERIWTAEPNAFFGPMYAHFEGGIAGVGGGGVAGIPFRTIFRICHMRLERFCLAQLAII